MTALKDKLTEAINAKNNDIKDFISNVEFFKK